MCLLCPLASLAGEETLRVEGLAVDRVLVHGSVDAEISQGDPVLMLVRGDKQSLEQQLFLFRELRSYSGEVRVEISVTRTFQS